MTGRGSIVKDRRNGRFPVTVERRSGKGGRSNHFGNSRFSTHVFGRFESEEEAIKEALNFAAHNPDDVFEVWALRQPAIPVLIASGKLARK